MQRLPTASAHIAVVRAAIFYVLSPILVMFVELADNQVFTFVILSL